MIYVLTKYHMISYSFSCHHQTKS